MTTTMVTKLANRFIAFDHQNPRVWDLFVRFTHEAIRANHSTFSAQSIIERIRWKTNVETRDNKFKINNDFAAFYARKYHKTFPQHDGFFRTRHSVADRSFIPNKVKYPKNRAVNAIVALYCVGTATAIGMFAFGV
jgi:hypothetical protein